MFVLVGGLTKSREVIETDKCQHHRIHRPAVRVSESRLSILLQQRRPMSNRIPMQQFESLYVADRGRRSNPDVFTLYDRVFYNLQAPQVKSQGLLTKEKNTGDARRIKGFEAWRRSAFTLDIDRDRGPLAYPYSKHQDQA